MFSSANRPPTAPALLAWLPVNVLPEIQTPPLLPST